MTAIQNPNTNTAPTNTSDAPTPEQQQQVVIPSLPSVEQERAAPQASRRDPLSDKISRLPKATRDLINIMLDDGLPYHVLIDELGEGGQGLGPQHLADWVRGRHQDYLKDRETIDGARASAEFASDLLRELGSTDPSQIYEACRVVAALQIFEAVLENGDAALRDMLKRNPASYLTMLNTLCNLTNSAIKCEQHRAQRDHGVSVANPSDERV